MKRALLLGMFCAALLSGAGGCRSRNYWPLKEGNTWEYVVRIREGGEALGERIFTVKSVTESGNVKRAVIHVSDGEGADAQGEIEIVSTPEGIYEDTSKQVQSGRRGAGKKMVINENDPPYFIRNKMSPGQEWVFTCGIQDKASNARTDIQGGGKFDGNEVVNAMAGEFDSLKVNWHIVDPSGFFDRNRAYWFKDGLGPVQMEEYTDAGRVVLKLKRAKVGGDKIGAW